MRTIILCAVLALLPMPGLAAPPAAPRVCVQPLGQYDSRLLRDVVEGIRCQFGLEVVVRPALPMPRAAWHAPRSRHRADRLVGYLAGLDGPDCLRVGFTSQDVSTTAHGVADWGVFGLGEVGGTAAVVSTFRLARRATRQVLRERAVKVVNHELGHVLGLDHCPTPGCVMQDAAGTVATVDREGGPLCAACRAKLERRTGVHARPDTDAASGKACVEP